MVMGAVGSDWSREERLKVGDGGGSGGREGAWENEEGTKVSTPSPSTSIGPR